MFKPRGQSVPHRILLAVFQPPATRAIWSLYMEELMSRRRVIVFSIFVLLIILTPPLTLAIANANVHDRVEIRSNQSAGTVQILIDGKSVMTVDTKGIHVKGDVDYNGTLTDTQGGGHE
jgi:hypothetical protein